MVQQQRSWEYDVTVVGLGAGVLLCTVLLLRMSPADQSNDDVSAFMV